MSNSTGTWLVLLFVLVAFPIFFSALWVGITLLMSFIGGWGKVAKVYAAAERPAGATELKHVTGMFGVASYKHVLTIITTDRGLYMENRKVFRFGHPPLFIPFSDIHRARRMTLFFWDYVAFEVGDPGLASIRLPSKVFEGTPIAITP